MAGQPESNSFEEYKRYLEDSIGSSDIVKPPRIMNPYNIFCFERQAQQKAKGKINIIELNKALANQWKDLPESKKQYYIKVYQIRKRQLDELKVEYEFLSNPGRSPTAYIIYYRKKYPILCKTNPNVNEQMITKMIAADWNNLDNVGRSPYIQEAKAQKDRRNLSDSDKKEYVQNYVQKVKEFKAKIQEDKSKILKKYGVYTKIQIKKQKQDQKKQKKKEKEDKKSQQKKQVKKKENIKSQSAIVMKKQKDKPQSQVKVNITEKKVQKQKEGTQKQQAKQIKGKKTVEKKKIENKNTKKIVKNKEQNQNQKQKQKQKQTIVKGNQQQKQLLKSKRNKPVEKIKKQDKVKKGRFQKKLTKSKKSEQKIVEKTKIIKKYSRVKNTKPKKSETTERKTEKISVVKIQPQENSRRAEGRRKKQTISKK